MNKFILICISILLLTSFQANIENPGINPNPTFNDGESLKYSLHYGIITAGAAVVTIRKETFNENLVFHSILTANTVGLADKLYKVLDIYESYFEPSSNLPLKSVRNIHEGNYKQFNIVGFNHEKNTITSQQSGEHKVPVNILDMVSALYYIRRIDFSDFKINGVIPVITYFGDEVFPFYIIFKGREILDTDLGKLKCLKFSPVVEPGRIFKKKDDMTVWLSDDANKIPVRVKFDLIVGSFKCDLISFKNLKYPLTPVKNQ